MKYYIYVLKSKKDKKSYNLNYYTGQEGYGRFTPAERKQFYRYARGSFEETKSWLRKSIRRKLIPNSQIDKLSKIINELGPKLNAFIKSTK